MVKRSEGDGKAGRDKWIKAQFWVIMALGLVSMVLMLRECVR